MNEYLSPHDNDYNFHVHLQITNKYVSFLAIEELPPVHPQVEKNVFVATSFQLVKYE